MKFLKPLFSMVAVLTLLALAACGSNGAQKNEDIQQGDNKQDSSHIVEHAMESNTEVPSAPKRIVILTNEGTEALLTLGIKPVGAVKSWVGDPWYEHIRDQMTDVEVVGTESQVNVEAIAKLTARLNHWE